MDKGISEKKRGLDLFLPSPESRVSCICGPRMEELPDS